MRLFKMGDYDLTERITLPSYKVNGINQYEEWKDADYTLHREITRNQIKGTFTVKFYSVDEYEEFLEALADATQEDGSVEAEVYMHNLRQVRSTYVFLEFDPKNTLPNINMGKDYDGFDITVTER